MEEAESEMNDSRMTVKSPTPMPTASPLVAARQSPLKTAFQNKHNQNIESAKRVVNFSPPQVLKTEKISQDKKENDIFKI